MSDMYTLETLREMLTYRRPAFTKTERKFIARYIDTVQGMQQDSFGNRILRIGDGTTMVSCHTDTVHNEGGRQDVNFDTKTQTISVAPRVVKTSRRHGARFTSTTVNNVTSYTIIKPTKWFKECLGADDCAGVFTALSMIEARVPALYVFHRGEECGGQGSRYIRDHIPGLVDGIERCIAFDRRGKFDIITHQSVGRCCSDDFAVALGKAIGMKHSPSRLGSFTDSANYITLVGECTNVSIGYACEHSASETLDWSYLQEIIDRLCTIDFDSLPNVRKAGDVEPRQTYYYGGSSYTGAYKRDSTTYGGKNDYVDWEGVDWSGVFGGYKDDEKASSSSFTPTETKTADELIQKYNQQVVLWRKSREYLDGYTQDTLDRKLDTTMEGGVECVCCPGSDTCLKSDEECMLNIEVDLIEDEPKDDEQDDKHVSRHVDDVDEWNENLLLRGL